MTALTDLRHKFRSLFDHPALSWLKGESARRDVCGLAIVLVACLTFLHNLNDPNKAFWDEVYYVTATERYQEGVASYASHPPLGLMLIAAGEAIAGKNDKIDTHPLALTKKTQKETPLPDGYNFYGARLMSALFGVMGAFVFYMIMLTLWNRALTAFAFSLIYVLENAYIVHFRAAMLDSFQYVFVMAAVWVFLQLFLKRIEKPALWYAAFGTLMGLAVMVKVNVVVFAALGGFLILRDTYDNRAALKAYIPRALKASALMVATFVAMIAAVFTLHVLVSPNNPPPDSAAGNFDRQHMPQSYQDYLAGERSLSPQIVWDATRGYYSFMNNDFTHIVKTEPNASTPILWPLMAKAITYRWDSSKGITSYIQMIGNVAQWLTAFAALWVALVMIMRRLSGTSRYLKGPEFSRDMNLLMALMAMYAVFMGVHMYLGTKRVMYIHHYIPALSLSYFILALVVKIGFQRFKVAVKWQAAGIAAMLAVFLVSFAFYSPLTFHKRLTLKQCEMRNVPLKVVNCHVPKKSVVRPQTRP
ncbi:phospholipid carrier-dependent glycosyltransferase [Asticcacaulis endophyticus]|uniref:Polyprenol-phosphate-mannose--protein mannosyltransferase n=1 Tax=Asticcacaulis endophyticus TaxID=1395890 RepID=A0A918UYI3_9CAUL|nr:phospholipid carrier-dependent glycosyltransferase [Asticcacaulis endophyticus]GGZ44459.1 dolichyl-phosphate-mannose--protein mannosyltransferase [Asticcacaulis endophyticus]